MSGSDAIFDQILMDLGLTEDTAQEEVPLMNAGEIDYSMDFLSFEEDVSSKGVEGLPLENVFEFVEDISSESVENFSLENVFECEGDVSSEILEDFSLENVCESID